ncbi:MAG: MFS transporter [Candidatus Micrarchaeota archaeon]|nr:MFS transporter [Candidatus Micrarchaeota archaeon]
MGFFSGIRKNVFALGAASFFTDISSEMVFPILPLFFSSFLGVGKEVIGLIEGVANSLSSLLEIVFGYWSDSKEKKKFVLAGYGISSISKLGIALSPSWLPMALFRWSDRLGKGIRTAPRDAIIASSSQKAVRGKAFGLHRSMDTLGAIIGPLAAIFLLSLLGESEASYRTILAAAVLPSIFAAALVYFFVSEPKRQHGLEGTKMGFWQKLGRLSPAYRQFLSVACLFSLSYFSFAFLLLRASEVGLKAESVLGLYLFFNISYALFSIPAGSLSDRIGRKQVLSAAIFLYAFVCIGFAFASEVVQLVALFVLYGIFVASFESVSRAFISDISAEKSRGLALGAYKTATGAILLPASAIFGALWSYFGAAVAFGAAAFVAGAAGVAMATWDFRAKASN